MLRRMGPLQGVLKLIPGLGNQLAGADMDESKLKRVEAIVLSMTPKERNHADRHRRRRRQRIAQGSGTTVEEVNRLMEARKMMEKMMKQMGPRQGHAVDPGHGRHGRLRGPRRWRCRAAAGRHELQGTPAQEKAKRKASRR